MNKTIVYRRCMIIDDKRRKDKVLSHFSLILLVCLFFIMSGCHPNPIASNITTSGADVPSTPQEWLNYEHKPWALTFDFPTDWQVDAPDFNAIVTPPTEIDEHPDFTHTVDLDTVAIGEYELKILPSDDSNARQYISLSLQSYTLAPGMTLAEWVTLHQQYGRREWGYEWEDYRPALESFPIAYSANIDEIWMESTRSETINTVSIWMSVGKLVYLVYGHHADETLTQIAERLVSSLEFDTATQQVLEDSPYYSVDATILQTALENN